LKRIRKLVARVVGWAAVVAAVLTGALLLAVAALRWVNPPFTAVQVQRRLEAWSKQEKYVKQQRFVPLARISKDLRHAVVAAEDSRFYQHHGIDWKEVEAVVEDAMEDGAAPRGASTITQQLVKNLFFTTHRNPVRKAFEFVLAPLVEWILPKDRILELYLNIVEWGSGVFGAEAAARRHYGISAAQLSREQAARLAACLPNPRKRKPQRMDRYSAVILDRMARMGW